jgi:hypothetical protein
MSSFFAGLDWASQTHAVCVIDVRILARAWLRVIWRAWTNRKTYDPNQHRAAQLLLKTAGG